MTGFVSVPSLYISLVILHLGRQLKDSELGVKTMEIGMRLYISKITFEIQMRGMN